MNGDTRGLAHSSFCESTRIVSTMENQVDKTHEHEMHTAARKGVITDPCIQLVHYPKLTWKLI